MNVVVVFI